MASADKAPRRYRTLSFSSTEEARAAIDQWVNLRSPPRTADELRILEDSHQAEFKRDFGRLLAQFDVAFDELVALVDQVNFVDKKSWPQHRALQFMFVAHNLKSFSSSVDRLSKGYYQDSVTLSRGLYETYHRVLFVSCFPDDPWGVVFDGLRGTRQFNLTNFVRDDLRLDWRKLYKTMSRFTHSNTPAVVDSLMRNERRIGEPERFGLVFDDDTRTKEFAATFWPFLLLAFLRFVIERLIGDATVRQPEQLSSAIEAVEWMTYLIRTNGKPMWMVVADDLDYIADLLSLADANGDWTTLARSRPRVPSDRAGPSSSDTEPSVDS